ncbi:MAG: hypothetical protein J1D85_01545 [Bacteroidales bacterium]|nr:hypothetical protein [Bacteroidales bacterium]
MRFNPYIILAAAVSVLPLVSCNKEDSIGTGAQSDTVRMSFTARTEETRAFLDGVKFNWESADQISVFGKELANARFSASNADGNTAVFSGEVCADGPFYAVYPYAAANTCSADGVITATLASERTVNSHNIGTSSLMCVAKADESGLLAFKNVCSVLRLSVTRDDVDRIIVSSNGGEALAGTIRVSAASDAPAAEVIAGEPSITLYPSGAVFAPGDYDISVLPGEYPSGITVTFVTYDDELEFHLGLDKKSSAMTLGRNSGLNIKPQQTGDWYTMIMDKSDLLAWKELASENGNSQQTATVKLGDDIDLEQEEWIPLGLTTSTSFKGVFDGQGHSIKNFYIEYGPVNENAGNYVGFFGHCGAAVSNVTFGGPDDDFSYILLTEGDGTTNVTNVGIIGATTSSVTNVKNYVPITVPEDYPYVLRVGGIAGAAFPGSDGASCFTGCENYGAITIGATENIKYSASQAVHWVGGIVAYLSNSVSGNPVRGCDFTDCISGGDIISENKYVCGIGGMLAQSAQPLYHTISNCKCTADIRSNASQGMYWKNASEQAVSEVRIGGIAGLYKGNDSKVTGCSNTGTIICKAPGFAAGIISRVNSSVTGLVIEDCTNSGEVALYSPADHYNESYAGGIVAFCGHASGSDGVEVGKGGTLKNCKNSGKVAGYDVPGTPGQSYNIGGIAGKLFSGYITDCENSGQVWSDQSLPVASYAVRLGGIAGVTRDVEVRGCRNLTAGTVTFNSSTAGLGNICIGGTVGYIDKSPAGSVTSCSNAARITGTADTEHPTTGLCVGGIVGVCYSADQLTGNSNTGAVTAAPLGSGCSFAGGVLGNNHSAAITTFMGNSNSGNVICSSTKSNDVGAGGVIGRAKFSTPLDVNGCTNSGAVTSNGDAGCSIGQAYSSELITITGGSYTGKVNGAVASSSNYVGKYLN